MAFDGLAQPDRGGLWPTPYTAHERRVIRTQAKYDRRRIPAIWLWPVLSPSQTEEGTDQHDLFWESARVTQGGRRYGEPIASHIYVDWTYEKKGRFIKGVTITKGTVRLGISRAECRRLGALLEPKVSPQENRWSSPDGTQEVGGQQVPVRGELEFLFIPVPGCVFRFANRYYQINQWEPQYLGPTDILTTLKGTGQQVSEDSTEPGMRQLVQPPTFRPERPRHAPEGVRNG